MAKIIFEKTLIKGRFVVYDDKPDFNFAYVNQVHGNLVVPDSCVGDEADGLFAKDLRAPLAIKTADCLPIAVIGEKGVAMLHAGWRGLAKEIICHENVKNIGPMQFFIGPCIHKEAFEVSQDFKNNFPGSPHFQQAEKLTFDLVAEARDQIKNSYPNAIFADSGICTFNDSNFHSYRQNKTDQRNWNILIQ